MSSVLLYHEQYVVFVGVCIVICRSIKRCFAVEKCVTCTHVVCHNIAIKLAVCVKRGAAQLGVTMHSINTEEITVSDTIVLQHGANAASYGWHAATSS